MSQRHETVDLRRMRQLSSHVVASGSVLAEEAQSQPISHDPPALSDQALADYITNGFHVCTVDELPPSFHLEFGERMRTMWDAGDQGAQDWLSLEPALINVLRAPSLVAAMQKFLGDDYQMAAPWCNRTGQGGMMGYHNTGADNVGNDQGFHKDGTDHGNTQSTVRDLRNRQTVMMYYPLGASLEQGPTAVVPKSQYYAMDRGERPGASEIGLGADGPMPSDSPDFVARDAWLQKSVDRIGGSAEDGFVDYRVVVPPGAVVICHHQLFHRASRSQQGYFRPMVKLGAARISEPVSDGDAASPPSNLPRSSLTTAMWNYAQGQSNNRSGTAASDVATCIRTLHEDPSDVKRLEAAHALADVVTGAACPEATLAMGALLGAFRLHLGNEAASRNAMYGLCAVGDAAVSPVCTVLAEAAKAGQVDSTANGWKLACNATHVLGQTATTHLSQELALAAIQPAMATARAEIDAYLASYDTKKKAEGHDYYAMERRRLLAEGSCSSGLIGHRAAVNNDSPIAAAALEMLLTVLSLDEPAEALPSFMWPGTVQNNAGCALLRLFSDARVPVVRGPIMPVFRANNDRAERMVAGSVREALRRSEVLCEVAPTETRVALRDRLKSVEWQWHIDAPLFEEI